MKPLPTPTTPAPLHRDEHPAALLAPSYPGHLLLLLALLAADITPIAGSTSRTTARSAASAWTSLKGFDWTVQNPVPTFESVFGTGKTPDLKIKLPEIKI